MKFRTSLLPSPKTTPSTVAALWPVHMASRWRTFIAARFGPTTAGRSAGKNETTGSSSPKRPSAMAMPTAVEVKLLDTE